MCKEKAIKATYKCPKCGLCYCLYHAEIADFECDCIEAPILEVI